MKGFFKKKKKRKKGRKGKGDKKKESDADKKARLDKAVAETKAFLKGKKRLRLIIGAGLFRIRLKHKLTSLTAKSSQPGVYDIRASVNPYTQWREENADDAAASFRGKVTTLKV